MNNNNGFKVLNLNSNKKRDSELESLLHSEHIVEIEKLVIGGEGLARLPFKDKLLVVFVAMAAPFEKVKIKITRVEKNHLIGDITEIITPSLVRRKPPCQYFEACGGCTWQHITEAEQVRQKEQILTDLLHKFIPGAKFELLPTVTSEKSLNYRNRIQLKQQGRELGYFKKASHQIVDISSCLIAENEISIQIPRVKKQIAEQATGQLQKQLNSTNELRKFELRLNHLNQFEYYPIGSDGEGLSFSQVNNAVNEKLILRIVEVIKQANPAFLTEFYAGAGNFSFPLLSELPGLHIESVELNAKLTAFAVKKLTELRLQKRLFAFTADCDSFIERRSLSKEFILLDPPRSGCSGAVLNKILHTNPQNILYISCHPAFLARDLKNILLYQPEYKIKVLQILDMFPQTYHFETLVLLSR